MTYIPLDRLRQEGFQPGLSLAWAWAAWRAWRNRRAAWRLARLDDRLLADIGLTRGDVDRALGLPLWQDPTRELYRIAWERRRLAALVRRVRPPAGAKKRFRPAAPPSILPQGEENASATAPRARRDAG